MPRSRRLTADEAAERLGLSVGCVTEMARQREIGRKEGGRWTFSEAEIRRVTREREDRAKVLKLRKRLENDRRRLNGLPPKRKPRKKRPSLDDDLTPRRRRRPRTIDGLGRMRLVISGKKFPRMVAVQSALFRSSAADAV